MHVLTTRYQGKSKPKPESEKCFFGLFWDFGSSKLIIITGSGKSLSQLSKTIRGWLVRWRIWRIPPSPSEHSSTAAAFASGSWGLNCWELSRSLWQLRTTRGRPLWEYAADGVKVALWLRSITVFPFTRAAAEHGRKERERERRVNYWSIWDAFPFS